MRTLLIAIFALVSSSISAAFGMEGKWESGAIPVTSLCKLKIEYNFKDNASVEALYKVTIDSTYAPGKYAAGIFTFSGTGTYAMDGDNMTVKVTEMDKNFTIQGIGENGEQINANITEESKGNEMAEEWFSFLTNSMAELVESLDFAAVKVTENEMTATLNGENVIFIEVIQ